MQKHEGPPGHNPPPTNVQFVLLVGILIGGITMYIIEGFTYAIAQVCR